MPATKKAPRADAQRNREKLLAAATSAFAAADGPVALDAIAKAAGVANGTLYRHFPTREDLVEAVYHDQVRRLQAQAAQLLAAHPPAVAFRLWTEAFADWASTKHGMVDALASIMAGGRLSMGQMRESLVGIVADFLAAGRAAGDLRSDVEAADVAALLAGVLNVAAQRDQVLRMLNLVVDGLEL